MVPLMGGGGGGGGGAGLVLGEIGDVDEESEGSRDRYVSNPRYTTFSAYGGVGSIGEASLPLSMGDALANLAGRGGRGGGVFVFTDLLASSSCKSSVGILNIVRGFGVGGTLGISLILSLINTFAAHT